MHSRPFPGANPHRCISPIAAFDVHRWHSIRKTAHIAPVRWIPAKQWTRTGWLAGSSVTARNSRTAWAAGISPVLSVNHSRGTIRTCFSPRAAHTSRSQSSGYGLAGSRVVRSVTTV